MKGGFVISEMLKDYYTMLMKLCVVRIWCMMYCSIRLKM